MSKLARAKRKRPCPICGKTDWCGISPDGKFALCNRVSDGAVKVSSTGSFVHVLIEDDPQKPRNARPKVVLIEKPKLSKTSAEHLNDVYEAFLHFNELAAGHAQNLRARGLDDIAIHLGDYKSMPTPVYANKLAERLAKTYALEGVPGFYYQNGWKFRTYGGVSGFFVPIKNPKGNIVGLTLRADGGQTWRIDGETVEVPKYLLISSDGKPRGASSGTPHHFALLGRPLIRRDLNRLKTTEIIVTEGALKANVIGEFVDVPVVGLVSVTTFDETFPALLKEIFPKLETAHIAFDMDAQTNPQVRMHRDRLELTLAKINLKTSITLWHSGAKGLDEHLVLQSKGQLAA